MCIVLPFSLAYYLNCIIIISNLLPYTTRIRGRVCSFSKWRKRFKEAPGNRALAGAILLVTRFVLFCKSSLYRGTRLPAFGGVTLRDLPSSRDTKIRLTTGRGMHLHPRIFCPSCRGAENRTRTSRTPCVYTTTILHPDRTKDVWAHACISRRFGRDPDFIFILDSASGLSYLGIF